MNDAFKDVTTAEDFVWPTLIHDEQLYKPMHILNDQSIHDVIQLSKPPDTQTQLLNDTCDMISSRILNTITDISVVVKTGSMSRGTHLSGSHDVDMTVLVPCDEKEFLTMLEPYTPSQPLPTIIINVRDKVAQLLINMYGETNVKTTGDAHIVKVTIHDTVFDITSVPDISPYTALDTITTKGIKSTDTTYRMLTGVLCKLEMNAYKQAPQDLKDMIRVIKYWFGINKWGKWKPRSFPIETFLIDVYLSRPQWTHLTLFKVFLEELIRCRRGERKPAKVFGTFLSAFIFIGRPKNVEQVMTQALQELNSL
jgi:hypothetical protein